MNGQVAAYLYLLKQHRELEPKPMCRERLPAAVLLVRQLYCGKGKSLDLAELLTKLHGTHRPLLHTLRTRRFLSH